jgi:NAD(P)-dependent dehydrogenase (short-subunit alcohol dehydrogenase family)
MKLKGKVAIVTGAASGIGLASARLFAKEGAKVVLVDVQEHMGERAARDIVAEGNEAVFARTDLSREAEVRQMVEETVARWGRIDVLFNNAGIVMVKRLEDMSEQEWDRIMAINVKATFLAIKYVAPVMRRGGGGAILNTGSIGSMIGQLNTPAYIATKGAIAMLSKTLALDYGRDRIRVNCLCPGITDTPMLREHLGHGPEGEAKIQQRLSRVPTGEILQPEDLARAALYLVCDDSLGVTGINHLVDGGMLAAAEYDIPL